MQELLLFIIVIGVLLIFNFDVKQLKSPALHYIQIVASLGLLALIWLFSENGNYGPKAILTALALGSIIKQLFTLKGTKQIN